MRKRKTKKKMSTADKLRKELPPQTFWDTTDEHEVNRRRLRAIEEPPVSITNLDERHPFFSNFEVVSQSGATYTVEIRDLGKRTYASNTIDFQINGLGTDKHIEAVLIHLAKRQKRAFNAAVKNGSNRIDIVPRGSYLVVERNKEQLPPALAKFIDEDGWIDDVDVFLEAAKRSRSPLLRISQEVAPWRQRRKQEIERRILKREYEEKVVSGAYPAHETKLPLYPYQREGMLHLAFNGRALLADEMGLGKTIQAVAAAALLHRLGKAKRVLVVTPASLKSEWEEQIAKFTDLGTTLVYGKPGNRWDLYEKGAFFTLVNYEQVMRDVDEINERMQPDIVILDEAQRIKNWTTKTAMSIKKLKSPYAFVLTGTPIENRIDDLYSIMNFVEPGLLGPLFRFNREYFTFNDKGRPDGYQNLDRLHERIKPLMVRRRKRDVETELPDRTDRTLFVEMTSIQRKFYAQHEHKVAMLTTILKKRSLRKEEQEELQRELAMMRMVCDTPYILDQEHKVCPKLKEIEKVLDKVLSNDESKVVIFSEWVRMLELIREHCDKEDVGYVWHTGSVPQQKRREEINRFKNDPTARIFLSSDSGGVGLNLQNAGVVINCDLPWNPAKLEQRIARVWRKHQEQAVTVVNLVSQGTIEHKMIETLSVKQGLADAILDLSLPFDEVKMRSTGKAFLEQLEQLMSKPKSIPAPRKTPPVEQPFAFGQLLADMLGELLISCEERSIESRSKLVIVVDGDTAQLRERIEKLAAEVFSETREIEVLDRATAETLERLIASGLLQQAGTSRTLLPADNQEEDAASALHEKIQTMEQETTRLLSMADLLINHQFSDGAVQPLKDAIDKFTLLNALKRGHPEPELEATAYAAYLPESLAAFAEAQPNSPDVRTASMQLKEFLQK